jgi:hypothetical protein
VALGKHVVRCEGVADTAIASNSFDCRHRPKFSRAAVRGWLATRAAGILPVLHYAFVFMLPASTANIAYLNGAASDPEDLGVHMNLICVLHTWGSAMTHHPHIAKIPPGGGVSLNGQQWAFLLAWILAAGARSLSPALAKAHRHQ